jgi:polyhydroxybutyrate depolymerase
MTSRQTNSRPGLAGLALLLSLAVGCAESEMNGNPGAAGTGASGAAGTGATAGTGGGAAGASGLGGAAGTGTAGSGGGVAGVAGQSGRGGGVAGATGVAGSGGGAAGSGGSSGGATAGRGGAGSAGRGGATGSAGSGAGAGSTGAGGSGSATPSAGCGKAGRPAGGRILVANDHIYDFPASYDGNKPFPLLIGFHAAGNPIDQIEGMTNNTDFATNYVRAFPKSAGNEWVYNTDISNKAYKVYDDLMANYCIDSSRVFATGHSSGAQMIVQILTHSDAARHMNFKAVAPVAASDYGVITVPTPVMYIHGKTDSVRGNDGASTVTRFRTANMCMTATMPYSQVAGCSSGGTTVNPGCVRYEGCTVPTIWCSHNDPQYSNTNHGVPCFAIRAMYDFFATIP